MTDSYNTLRQMLGLPQGLEGPGLSPDVGLELDFLEGLGVSVTSKVVGIDGNALGLQGSMAVPENQRWYVNAVSLSKEGSLPGQAHVVFEPVVGGADVVLTDDCAATASVGISAHANLSRLLMEAGDLLRIFVTVVGGAGATYKLEAAFLRLAFQ